MQRRCPPRAPPALALLLLAVSLQLSSALPDASDDVSGRDKRSSAFSLRQFIAQNKMSAGGGRGIPQRKGQVSTFQGGCVSRPMNPPHTLIACHTNSGCRLSCLRDHVFPNGERRAIAICNDGKWEVEGTDWTTIPDCAPECRPPCQNNGICIKPNVCNCSESYVGPRCQYNRLPCLNDSPLPANSLRRCNAKTCTITCVSGHQFPDGSSITNLICRDGTWSPSRKDWASVPDCQPTCNPPCQNGGDCLSFNTCQCPQGFRGPQCQYAKEVCDPEKLNFNGQYKCSGDLNTLTCHLKCTSGRFSVEPAQSYKCEYATGTFLPTPIPHCIYDTMIEIMPRLPASGLSTYTIESERKKESSSWTHSNWSEILNKIPLDTNIFHTTLEKTRTSGTCYAWGDHFKTFDGRILSFQSSCSYTLVQDAVNNIFSVHLEPQVNGSRSIKIFAQDKEYTLSKNENDLPILKVGSRIFAIPTQHPGVSVKFIAHFVEFSVSLAGFSLMWDTQSLVILNVQEHLWNGTVGLCGRIDGYPENDFQMKDGKIASRIIPFVNSWQVQRLGETCSSTPQELSPCDTPSSGDGTATEASSFCNKLLSDPQFARCRSVVDVQQYYEACRWDFCSCQSEITRNNSHECACKSIAMFIKECSIHDVTVLNWRDSTTCPMECKGGRVYMSCNPENQPSCGSGEEVQETSVFRDRKGSPCIEGCYCPPGTVLHEQQCITHEQCPCQLRGRSFPPGHTIPKDCNTCTCEKGKWKCTQNRCSSRCSAIGDPHYTTFDGKRYDFMGKCSYYLVKGENYSIEAENVACAGAISKNMGFARNVDEKSPSCTKSVTVRIGDKIILLQQGRNILVNGIQVTKLPAEISGTFIHPVSSIFTLVKLPNNLTVWWDGISSVYVDASPSQHGKTRGLCGTFTMNQKDDFLTPEEDIEQSAIAFANKWKTDEKCPNEPEVEKPQPCDINPHKKESANKYCSRIKGPLFERCHWVVDPEPFYYDCMYDMCSCEQSVGQCLCPIIAAYAKECVRKGIHIDWRGSVRECGIHCPSGQQYQLCGNTCTHSCGTIAYVPNCEHQCVEGCNCPEGQTLNDETGECIPISTCTCHYNGLEFQPGQKEIRSSSKGPQLCTCSNAKWICQLATSEEIKLYPDISTIKYNCSARNNEEYTSCLNSAPLTCKTMHNAHLSTPAICKGGCTCKKGYVLDQDTKHCIRPSECPCHHGGKSYSEGNSIQEDCNTCVCKSGKWKCSEHVCAGVCSTWGDSHYKTFDSRIFDFHGTCDYLLAKGTLSKDDSFDVIIQNVDCGSLEVSCSKSITLKVGMGSTQEVITFTKDKPLPVITGLDRIQVRVAGLFVFAEVTDLGLVVQWDQGTRVYVKVEPKWKGKIKGLCGNYNDDMLDDFQTPSGGVAEVSAALFGDSWRLQSYCPESVDITDACTQHPNRKRWAMQKCGILKSTLFQPCHSEVSVEPYLERCIFDSCVCDMGGDCECLCTALAAYAHECNANGVHIRWRSQNLCPMQCDEKCSTYNPCIDTCPKTTCENQFIINSLTQLCKEDTCVEGCELKPCPPGQVYYNKTALECVPIASCKTVCLEENGITYYEGDLMEEDECHSCYCSRHKKSCKGIPCSTSPRPSPETTLVPGDHPIQCKSGWTSWINNNFRDNSKNETEEKEPMPSQSFLSSLSHGSAHCSLSQVKFIECRITSNHKSHKESGLNVSCDIDEGLVCHGNECPDFEIRLYCNCGSVSTSTFPPEITTSMKICDPTRPNTHHEENCHLFYHCTDTTNGIKFVEKSCGPNMMFDRDRQVCDHSSSVITKWPDCSGSTEAPLISTTITPAISEMLTTSRTPLSTVSTASPFLTSTYSGLEVTPTGCKPKDVWKSCGIPCNQVCLYYDSILKRRGFCSSPDDCTEGCFSEEMSGGCPSGNMWRDRDTCVSIADCTCYSHSGDPVKPGEIRYESECKICQCINNEYVCDTSRCIETTEAAFVTEGAPPTVPTLESRNIVTFPSTSTPPQPCEDNKYVPLIEGKNRLPDAAFTASGNVSGMNQQPHFARILKNSNNEYAWTPAIKNKTQYLQINLGDVKPVFGVSVQGSPSGFVTSYLVLYSAGGDKFHYAKPHGANEFRGPTDNQTPQVQMFNQPVEAQYIRFFPQTWEKTISMRVEIYGCSEGEEVLSTTESETIYTTTISSATISSTIIYSTPSDECLDEMGLDNGMMSDQQITLSSIKDNNFNKFGPSQLHLNAVVVDLKENGGSWMPLLNDKDQWIQFDFIEPRNLTGFITKGSEKTNDWVESFKIFYSHDGTSWNPFLQDDGTEKIFPGNYDAISPFQNTFGHILRTRFLRLTPFKWHGNIAVKAEVLGCFEPYPTRTTETITPETTPSPECHICQGVPFEKKQKAACLQCSPDLWWDGDSCVNRTHCPCFVNHIRYDVGKVYETEECNECVCKLNGLQECKKKECKKNCEPGQQRVLTAVCGCTCKPCPKETVLCPTSNICINESVWCNGVEDCPDDERNCPINLTPSPTPVLVTTPCPPISCPPGTKPVKMSSITGRNRSKGLKGATNRKGIKGKQQSSIVSQMECEPVACIPIYEPTTERPTNCSNIKPKCAASYLLVRVPTTESCPEYKCVPRHGICNITHNTVDTFDGIEFNHEICNHILARDNIEMKWNISILKTCVEEESCSRHLSIIHDTQTIKLYSDLRVELNGIIYAPHETKHLGGRYKPFAIYNVGNSLIFQSHRYGFWVVWDRNQNAKIGVTGKLFGAVEGLCGTLNGNINDDRTTPEHKVVKSNIEFVKSWAIPGAPECETIKCPTELQIQAQDICMSLRTSSLSRCSSILDLERFIGRCMESTCSCLGSATKNKINVQNCRCSALQEFVTTCQSADSSIDLTGWRTEHGCLVECPPSLVYHDCYRHKCEPTCDGINDIESCETMSGTCFSGCFCPDGLLRQNDKCITPQECRDCVCDGFGDPQYMSFDRSNFTFNGNCTYIASQDTNKTYQVLVTNRQCHDEPASTCAQAVEVHYLNHSVSVKYDRKMNEKFQLTTSVDDKLITQFPHKEIPWLQLHFVESSEITIFVLPIQLEVTFIFHNYAFTVRLPSSIFKNKTEGLCGNCNRNKADDFLTSKGELTNDTDKFGLSWLYPRPQADQCDVPAKDIGCKPLPPTEDPCLQLYESSVFRKCHNILDPAPYVVACQYDLCHSLNRTDAACRDMEAYVSACERAGICLDWRNVDMCPFKCPEGRQYRPCQSGCSKTCEIIDGITSNCSSLVPDGCYCPDNQVLRDNKCVDISKCYSCDIGRFDGDSWQQDKCTNCTCIGSRKECNHTICSNVKTICKDGMIPIEEKSHEECCKKVICVPGPSETTCPPPQIPLCRGDQNATSIVGADGCITVVCKCLPCKSKTKAKVWFPEDEGELGHITEEAEEEEEEEIKTEIGVRLEIDNSGCCPEKIPVCYPEDCPPKFCRKPFLPKNKTTNPPKCCVDYECVPPPNSCLIEDINTGNIIEKKVGSVWQKGPCETCECKEVSGTLESSCSKTVCPAADINPNITENYVIDSKIFPGECCPSIQRTACRINGTILEPGKQIVHYGPDHCTFYYCKSTGGTLERNFEIERCNTNCKLGWKYIKPEQELGQCCGECKPVGCVIDGILHQQDEKWISSDSCTEYLCSQLNGTFQVITNTTTCPTLTKEIYNDYVVDERKEPNKCCKVQVFLRCKHNGEVYEAGETWVSPENPCIKYSCELLPNGELVKKETIETCSTNCSKGWQYVPAEPGSRICCGECKQIACEFEETTYPPNFSWSSSDGCANYTCAVTTTGKFQVISSIEACPSIISCPPERIYQERCCRKCKMDQLSHTKECEVKKVPAIGDKAIKELRNKNVLCINKELDGFTECEGMCFSETKFSIEFNSYVKSCNCCQPEKYILLNVPMECEDGHSYNKTINVPSTCKCLECKETSKAPRKQPVH